MLDPVYVVNGMAGLLGYIEEGRFRAGENVVFLHTGSSMGLFGYHSTILGSSSRTPRLPLLNRHSVV